MGYTCLRVFYRITRLVHELFFVLHLLRHILHFLQFVMVQLLLLQVYPYLDHIFVSQEGTFYQVIDIVVAGNLGRGYFVLFDVFA